MTIVDEGLKDYSNISKPTIFADDTNTIFTHSNYTDLKNEINIVIEKMSKWFKTSSLTLDFNKTQYKVSGLKQFINLLKPGVFVTYHQV
jgi:hypothetical protein